MWSYDRLDNKINTIVYVYQSQDSKDTIRQTGLSSNYN